MLAQQCHPVIKLHLRQWGGAGPAHGMRGAISAGLLDFLFTFFFKKKGKKQDLCCKNLYLKHLLCSQHPNRHVLY